MFSISSTGSFWMVHGHGDFQRNYTTEVQLLFVRHKFVLYFQTSLQVLYQRAGGNLFQYFLYKIWQVLISLSVQNILDYLVYLKNIPNRRFAGKRICTNRWWDGFCCFLPSFQALYWAWQTFQGENPNGFTSLCEMIAWNGIKWDPNLLLLT